MRWREKRHAERGHDYWRVYAGREAARRSDALRQTYQLRSAGVVLNVDVYPQPKRDAPVVLFNHGSAGYARLFVRLALEFHDLGYTVVLPDQKGQGFSGGTRGDCTVADATQNIVDVARWAKARFEGPLFMAGASLGGGLTYAAAAAGAPVQAIACLNLFDFGERLTGQALARFPVPVPPRFLLRPFIRLLGWLRLPFGWFGRFDHLTDESDAAFQAQWRDDPVPPKQVSLRALASLVTTSPAIPFERNTIPVLVLNQEADKMVSPALTRRNYLRLGGPKQYVLLKGAGHWSNRPPFLQEVASGCDAWFRTHGSSSCAHRAGHHRF